MFDDGIMVSRAEPSRAEPSRAEPAFAPGHERARIAGPLPAVSLPA